MQKRLQQNSTIYTIKADYRKFKHIHYSVDAFRENKKSASSGEVRWVDGFVGRMKLDAKKIEFPEFGDLHEVASQIARIARTTAGTRKKNIVTSDSRTF